MSKKKDTKLEESECNDNEFIIIGPDGTKIPFIKVSELYRELNAEKKSSNLPRTRKTKDILNKTEIDTPE